MTPCIRVKEGVQFAAISPGGFRIFAAIVHAADFIAHDITITSGTDGEHSGPDDPHHRGEAYDLRTHDLPDPKLALNAIMAFLGDVKFYGFVEDEGTDNEHIHVQVRKGMMYP